MKIFANQDAKVNNVMVKKGENDVDEWVVNALRNAGVLIEDKPKPGVKTPIKKVVGKLKKSKSKKKK